MALDLDLDHVTALNEMLSPTELDGLLERGEAQLAQIVAALQAAWSGKNLELARREAHQLVGLAGSIGCKALAMAARDVETATPARLQTQLDEILRLVPLTIEALHRWRASVAGQN